MRPVIEDNYNDSPAQVEVVRAGTLLYRVTELDSRYAPNSFNSTNIRPLGHNLQGRFDPVNDTHGGYLYVAPSLTGVVAEGILRNRKIPREHVVPRQWLQKSLAIMQLDEDVTVAQLYGPSMRMLNLDASICSGQRYTYPDSADWKNRVDNYTISRSIGHRIIDNTPHASGLKYTSRNNDDVQSLLLLGRFGEPEITVLEQFDILRDEEAAKLVVGTLAEYGLHYLGELPGQRSSS